MPVKVDPMLLKLRYKDQKKSHFFFKKIQHIDFASYFPICPARRFSAAQKGVSAQSHANQEGGRHLLKHLDQKNQRRKNVPFVQILLVYLMKVVGSIKKMDQMTDLLLTDELLMSMCGFNAYQVKNLAVPQWEIR
jgi:hypothetical protein